MSIFKSLFSKKPKEPDYPEVLDFSAVKTDFHSHLIPGIDDGVKTVEESLDMIRAFSELGFKHLITTPHVMSDYFRNSPETILGGLEIVRAAIKREGIPVTLDAAAEYYIDEGFLKILHSGKILPIREKYILIEVSYINPPDNLHHIIFEIIVNGYKPILAHPERYPYWYDRFSEYAKIREAGALLQLNTNSLTGYYGPGAKMIAEKLIDEQLIDFIGSDLHGQRHLDALKNIFREKHFRKLIAMGNLKNGDL